MDAIYDCVADFVNEDRLKDITCPSCSTDVQSDQWMTEPDIGLCHVALEFWNWPSFESKGWGLSIPELITERTGRKLRHSWGRM